MFKGIETNYHRNGTLSFKREYINGKINGYVKQYYDNGNILSEVEYIND